MGAIANPAVPSNLPPQSYPRNLARDGTEKKRETEQIGGWPLKQQPDRYCHGKAIRQIRAITQRQHKMRQGDDTYAD